MLNREVAGDAVGLQIRVFRMTGGKAPEPVDSRVCMNAKAKQKQNSPVFSFNSKLVHLGRSKNVLLMDQ